MVGEEPERDQYRDRENHNEGTHERAFHSGSAGAAIQCVGSSSIATQMSLCASILTMLEPASCPPATFSYRLIASSRGVPRL